MFSCIRGAYLTSSSVVYAIAERQRAMLRVIEYVANDVVTSTIRCGLVPMLQC